MIFDKYMYMLNVNKKNIFKISVFNGVLLFVLIWNNKWNVYFKNMNNKLFFFFIGCFCIIVILSVCLFMIYLFIYCFIWLGYLLFKYYMVCNFDK